MPDLLDNISQISIYIKDDLDERVNEVALAPSLSIGANWAKTPVIARIVPSAGAEILRYSAFEFVAYLRSWHRTSLILDFK